MPQLTITVNIDETPWEDIAEKRGTDQMIEAMGGVPIRIGALPRGMASGATAVAIMIELPDGRVVLTETSLALFLMAAQALKAKYPNG